MKQKKKIGRMMLGFLLTLAMVVSTFTGIVPGMSMTANAAQVTETVTWDYATWKAVRSGDTKNEITFTGGRKFSGSGNLYDSETTSFIAPDGYVFTQIEFPTTYTSIGNGESANSGTFSVVNYTFDSTQDHRTVDGKMVTWTGESDTVSFQKDTYAIEYIKFTMVGEGVDVESVTINHSELTLDVGDTYRGFVVDVAPDETTDKTIKWSSDNTDVVTVDSNGNITAVAAGTAIITVTATNGTDDTGDDKFVTCTVTVKEPVTYTVTFKVTNGSWNDGTTAAKTVTLDGYKGDALKLAADDIPAVGLKPDDNYLSGSWDTTPSTEMEINTDTTYTYTYVKKETDTSIETEVNASDDAPAVKVDNLNDDLAVKLLTDEEKAEYEDGTPVLVYLDVKAIDKADVPTADITAIEKTNSADGYTYGECLDLSLWKKLGNGTPTQIHDTNGNPIKITISIPDVLKNVPEGYTRTYRIVRVHNGVSTVLAEGTGASLEVSSDKFSSYFIIFKDVKKATDDKKQDTPTTDTKNTDTKAPKTGDKINMGVIVMIMIDSAMAALYLTLSRRKIK